MIAAVDLEQLRELVRAEMKAHLSLVPSGRGKPLSMKPEAIRQRRWYDRHCRKAPTEVQGDRSPNGKPNGTNPPHDLIARNAVDLDLGSKKKQKSTSPSKIATPEPVRRTRAESDFKRECARFYKGFSRVVKTYTGRDYPERAPFGDQKACHALVSELGTDTALQEAREFCRRDWQPTCEFRYPRISLLRFKLIEREKRQAEARKPPPRPPPRALEQEDPRPRIVPGERPRASVDAPRPIQGDIAAALAELKAKAERRGAP